MEQLCFFKFPRPLLERFGKEFFAGVPREPGVYVFTGESGKPLYVGHSRNLRLRLSYYKNAQPEREPRRIVRLVHQVRNIEMECCATLHAAQVRELALIRQLRPRFNVAHTLSSTYSFFAFRERPGGFALRLSMSAARREGETVLGGFRNRGLCANAFGALARTIVAQEREITSVYDFPASLNARAREWHLDEMWRAELSELICGENASFLERTAQLAERAADPFLRQVFETDLIILSEFSELAAQMAELRRKREVNVLSQEALQVSAKLCPRTEMKVSPKENSAAPDVENPLFD